MDPLNPVEMLNSVDLLLIYIGVMEGGNLKMCRTKIQTAIQVIQKGLKVSFSALNSRYRIKKKKSLLHEDLKDTKIYHLLFSALVTPLLFHTVFFQMAAVIKREKTIKFSSMSLVSEVKGIA